MAKEVILRTGTRGFGESDPLHVHVDTDMTTPHDCKTCHNIYVTMACADAASKAAELSAKIGDSLAAEKYRRTAISLYLSLAKAPDK